MNPIKIGMIGFGRMGGFYLEQMQKSGRWEVAYICDVSAESREEARRLAPQAQVIADEQIIFDDPEVAVVGLFALADSRLSQIGKAVAAGKHMRVAVELVADEDAVLGGVHDVIQVTAQTLDHIEIVHIVAI